MSASIELGSGASALIPRSGREPLVIALLNNMPDAALQTTEQQFRELLSVAGADYDIRLKLFSFPELIRAESGQRYVAEHYEPIDRLWTGTFDGLIVTGAEPRTATLPEEAYWPSLRRLVDWSDESATPTVWSCLAAHCAVLHLDGIERRRLSGKISGVFRCMKTGDHPLISGLPASWPIPHSRHNTIDPEQLVAAGYDVVAYSDDAGVDTFIQQRRALFVFFQGHPEYDPGALFREYRRDVARYLAGMMERYPEMPRGYFDDEMADAFLAFRARAQRQRSRELLEDFPQREATLHATHAWHSAAVRIYSNWLECISAHRHGQRIG